MMPREACLRDCVLFLGNEGNAETFANYLYPFGISLQRIECLIFDYEIETSGETDAAKHT